MPDGINKGVEILDLHGGNPVHINLNVRKKLDKVLMGGKFAEQTVVNPTAFQQCHHLIVQMQLRQWRVDLLPVLCPAQQIIDGNPIEVCQRDKVAMIDFLTLYRRCTWTRNGEKRIVWRCVSRLDYGKKYCHNSPTLDEAPLQQAILAALNTAMADKNSLIRQITDAMETEIIPFPGGTMSLGDIERRLRELEQQFQTLLEKATDDPAAYGGQFKEILDEQTFLKEKRSGILADNNEQAKANQRIQDAAQTLENASPHITEWDESAVRQLVETVKVLSKDEIAITLKGGIEICQKIMY